MSARLSSGYDAILVDLDGVVYRGNQAVPKAAEALAAVRRAGTRLLFITNNSARTPEQVVDRLAGVGVTAAPHEVLTSGLATAAMLRREGPAGRSAFVIGEGGLREALHGAGIRVVDGEPDGTDLVVIGWDRALDYSKLKTACLLVRAGARLVATNPDPTYPAPDGLWPGTGSILAAVVAATGALPTVVGKPYPGLFEAGAAATGATHPLVVGDRLDTDIEGASGLGWDSLLVFSGAASPPDLMNARVLPTFVAPTLDILGDAVPASRFRSALPLDAPAIGALLEASGLSSVGVEDRLDTTVVSFDGIQPRRAPGRGEAPVLDATACVEDVGGFGLLKSVAVRSSCRARGVGMLAVAAAARVARERGIGHLSLFTSTGRGFFERLGFRPVDRSDLPAPVAESPQGGEECAVSAVAMCLELETA